MHGYIALSVLYILYTYPFFNAFPETPPWHCSTLVVPTDVSKTFSSGTSVVCQVSTSFQNVCSRATLFCIKHSNTLFEPVHSSSSGNSHTAWVWWEIMGGVPTWFKSHPYLAEPGKKEREGGAWKLRIAKSSTEMQWPRWSQHREMLRWLSEIIALMG